MLRLSRRSFLSAAGLLAIQCSYPSFAHGAVADGNKLILVILRGGMDGLHAVPPIGDPHYASVRGGLALKNSVPMLDGFFGLHPALGGLMPLYRKGEVLFVHAAATPYRDRSHFDGQNVLENGGERANPNSQGWLGRILPGLNHAQSSVLAVGASVPLVLRGDVPVEAWAPSPLPGLPPSFVDKLRMLYEGDTQLSMALEEGVQSEQFVAQALGGDQMAGRRGSDFRALAEASAKIMAADGGPSIVVLDAGGWDTHTAQGNDNQGRMISPLTQLGDGIAAMAQALGPQWRKTVVVCAGEFGRTVAMNGTNGTDHGTGGVMILAGGGVAGGRVMGAWPGLAPEHLYQGRDLAPTTDVRAVFAGLLRDHLSVNPALAFANVAPMSGMLRS